ncbi:hypothetical protein [Aquirufa antheringensis]|jgi:hypothetical protein|uniref:Uncharacterized protein n=1 Tax=Aquirufa antheringensis TaxID=2516559 RepID=A0A4V2IVK6_9BACT|nr:hypothetical protein [Aquirufa antheringensis]MCZ2485419.1 hypothetical protein [Aquirufa antheringensis]TBH72095.1 hypothetical protein EWU20_09750 [Aquirufa antheringensis]
MLRPLRYITPYFLYVLAFLAFTKTGFYSWVPLQIGTLYLFLTSLGASLTFLDTAGRAVAMGLLCGTFGINAAHELGHRVKPAHRLPGMILLALFPSIWFKVMHRQMDRFGIIPRYCFINLLVSKFGNYS